MGRDYGGAAAQQDESGGTSGLIKSIPSQAGEPRKGSKDVTTLLAQRAATAQHAHGNAVKLTASIAAAAAAFSAVVAEPKSSTEALTGAVAQASDESIDDGLVTSPAGNLGGKAANEGTPRSARGHRQVRQGRGDADGAGAQVGMGRSQRHQKLEISVAKLQKLHEEPMSPKLVKKPKAASKWGQQHDVQTCPLQQQSDHDRKETSDDRSQCAEDIKDRIERKLALVFGDRTKRDDRKSGVAPTRFGTC